MVFHQNLYEINTRVWLHKLNEKFDRKITLLEVPEEYWVEIIDKGFDWIWLMGVWQHSSLTSEDLNRHPELVKEINKALPEWEVADVVGSPYSIVKYELNPLLGRNNDLLQVKNELNRMGAKLMLDFVPNHFGNATPLVISHPEYFISLETTPSELSLFKKVDTQRGLRWMAYGKDPYFPPWDDTYQLNYFNQDTRVFMTDTLTRIAIQCDGVRCDMAMLCLNEIFEKTWGRYLQQLGLKRPQTEFWTEIIAEIKNAFPDFVFLAEVYWDLGWRLQQLGFEYTYDKRLYERLETGSPQSVLDHLKADLAYQKRSLRFIENHDEKRAMTFGKDKSRAAAVISGTVPGLSLYHQGQLEGNKIKIPVQLRRKKNEHPDYEMESTYNTLLSFTTQLVFQQGQWSLLNISEAWKGNNSWQNLLTWQWRINHHEQASLIVVNYSSVRSQARIFPILDNKSKKGSSLILTDKTDGNVYKRDRTDTVQNGLYIDLEPYNFHLFNLQQV